MEYARLTRRCDVAYLGRLFFLGLVARRTVPLLLLACISSPVDRPGDRWQPTEPPAAVAPGDLALAASDGVLGGTLELSVTGAQAYEEVLLVRSSRGAGEGTCFGVLGGACLGLLDPVRLLPSVWTALDGTAALSVPLPADAGLEGATPCFQAIVIRGLGGEHAELAAPACATLGRDSDGDGVIDLTDPCPDDPIDACDVPACEHLGWKEGDADWTCPDGMRMPTIDEWDAVEPCIADEDWATFGYYSDVAISVGGCDCKWNPSWCSQPSIETIREGRMCGDYAQLHICLSD